MYYLSASQTFVSENDHVYVDNFTITIKYDNHLGISRTKPGSYDLRLFYHLKVLRPFPLCIGSFLEKGTGLK